LQCCPSKKNSNTQGSLNVKLRVSSATGGKYADWKWALESWYKEKINFDPAAIDSYVLRSVSGSADYFPGYLVTFLVIALYF